MEAIRPLQFQELVGAGILEEGGAEGVSDLFSQVLARQGVKPVGPGPNPVVLKPEEQAAGLSGSGSEDPLPADLQETAAPGEQRLAEVAPSGIAVLATAPVMAMVGTIGLDPGAPIPIAPVLGERPVTRQEDGDRNSGSRLFSGPSFFPGPGSAAGGSFFTAPPDQGLRYCPAKGQFSGVSSHCG